jgi:hypothetical protein
MRGVEAFPRIRVQNTWNWNPSIHESPEAIKRNPAALSAT